MPCIVLMRTSGGWIVDISKSICKSIAKDKRTLQQLRGQVKRMYKAKTKTKQPPRQLDRRARCPSSAVNPADAALGASRVATGDFEADSDRHWSRRASPRIANMSPLWDGKNRRRG